MTPNRRVDWLFVTVLSGLGLALCLVANVAGWLIERFLAAYGPWILDNADWIVAVVVTVCVICLAVLAVAEKARKDNPSW